MSRKDRIHDAVKNALIKDGWTVTDDPFRIHYEDAEVVVNIIEEEIVTWINSYATEAS